MSGKDEETTEGKGKRRVFSFRLTNEVEEDLDEVTNNLSNGNKTDFFKEAIRFFKDNPDLYGQGKVQVADSQVTKEDLEELRSDLFHQLNQNLSYIQEMTQLLLDQKENGYRANRIESIKTVLLNYDKIEELDTYSKVEKYLVKKIPDLKEEIEENRIYNDVLFELMQEGHVIYNQRTKRLNWRDNKE